ncbi:hypothetical protein IAU60_005059 [Kwoniella sp. DSM 27419]
MTRLGPDSTATATSGDFLPLLSLDTRSFNIPPRSRRCIRCASTDEVEQRRHDSYVTKLADAQADRPQEPVQEVTPQLHIANYSRLNKASLIEHILGAQRALTIATNNERLHTRRRSRSPRSSIDKDVACDLQPSGSSGEEESPCDEEPQTRRDVGSVSKPIQAALRCADVSDSLLPTDGGFSSRIVKPGSRGRGGVNIPHVLATTDTTGAKPSINTEQKQNHPEKPMTGNRIANDRQGKLPKRKTSFIAPRPTPTVGLSECPPTQDVAEREGEGLIAHFATISQRVDFVRSHFVNQCCHLLNGHRTFLGEEEASTPSSTGGSAVQALCFRGLHPAFYEVTEPEAFVVAFRFWISRFHSLLSVGNGEAWSVMGHSLGHLGPDFSAWPRVVECRALTRDIWLVGTAPHPVGRSYDHRSAADPITQFIVVAKNGGVIGSHDRPLWSTSGHKNMPFIRADWEAFIGEAQDKTGGHMGDIMSIIKTKDSHSYPCGISRGWLNRVAHHKDCQELRRIAERAVLSSCAANSGSMATATQLDIEQFGIARKCALKTRARLDLYLPE